MHGPVCLLSQYDPKATVIILSFGIDRSGRSEQTQIRQLLEEQSDQGLHCLLLGAVLSGSSLFAIPFALF